jgi:PPE-repeat protein
MDFAALPPEVNSGRMYAGPGAGPMLAAASAWERLAVELGSAAKAYESVIAGLTGQGWLGPASESMAAAVVPYAGLMGATAAQAERTAAQVAAAASAFEEAYAAMVPPSLVAVNRSQLASLVAANVLGQNSAAIAATEAEYGQMWAQDAAVMYGYAGQSAAAAAVTPFAQPPSTISPAGAGGQAGAVAQAAAGSAHSQLSQLLSAIPQALHGLSSVQATPTPPVQVVPSVSQVASYVEAVAKSIVPANDAILSVLFSLAQFARNLTIDLDIAAANAAAAAAGLPTNALASAESTVSAGVGNAGVVGKLAVPPTWQETAPDATMAVAALPDTSPGTAAAGRRRCSRGPRRAFRRHGCGGFGRPGNRRLGTAQPSGRGREPRRSTPARTPCRRTSGRPRRTALAQHRSGPTQGHAGGTGTATGCARSAFGPRYCNQARRAVAESGVTGMDFSALPPEVNSGRMYAGPGAGPLLAAASAWERLAVELGSAAKAYESVVTGLTDQGWLGPASESMVAAAAPYAGWLGATAAQAEQTATQATAAAAAYEAAFAATVPPPVIAANRSRLASLLASNVLGQNNAAIAATEAEYGQMWVQDAATMYGYAGRSAAAAAVTPFSQPPTTTNPAGMGGQAGSAHSQLSQLVNAIPQALHGLSSAQAAPAAPAPPVQVVPSLSQIASYVEAAAKSTLVPNDAIISVLFSLAQFARNLTIDLDFAAANAAASGSGSAAAGLTSVESASVGGAASVVSAGSGDAGLVGKLSVPPGWAQAAPEAKMVAAALPGTSPGGAPAAAPGGLFADMALAGLIGRGMAGSAPRSTPAAVMNGHAHGRLERMVAELAGTHEVQHWHVDPSRLDSLLAELAEKPGVHAVHVNDDGRGKFELPPQPGQEDEGLPPHRPRA